MKQCVFCKGWGLMLARRDGRLTMLDCDRCKGSGKSIPLKGEVATFEKRP